MNICRNGSRQKRQTRPFLFSTWPKYFCEIAATGMIYIEGCRSVAKIIALVRRDDLQALELCQMTSVTSFEPLSTQLALKFGGSAKKKLSKFSENFSIFMLAPHLLQRSLIKNISKVIFCIATYQILKQQRKNCVQM